MNKELIYGVLIILGLLAAVLVPAVIIEGKPIWFAGLAILVILLVAAVGAAGATLILMGALKIKR